MRQDHRASRKKSYTPPSMREDIGKSTHVEVLKTLEKALELHRQGNLENSKSLYLQALALNPENFDTLHLLGCLSNDQKDYTAAVGWFSKALKINALNAACFSNLGVALRALKKFPEALFCYDQAITLNLNFVDAHSNRCNVLLDLKRFSEALESADRAVNLDSEHAKALNNRGNVYLELGDCAAAIDNFKLATKVQRNFSQAYFNLAVANLLSGNFRDGWESYESRWQTDYMAEAFLSRKIDQPLWSGKEALRGKTLFVFSEQGFGDTIQFCRYIPLLAQLDAKIIFEVQASLFRLLSKMNEFATVIIKGDIVPDFDYYCPLLSVPARLKTDLESIPEIACSIFIDEKTRNFWQFKLGEPERPRIGLVWSGSSTHARDANRSISLTQFIKHLPSGFEYISLQKEVRE